MEEQVQEAASVDERLARLGMKEATSRLTKKKAATQKMHLAYQHFKYVRQEALDSYQAKELTPHRKRFAYAALAEYPGVPPVEVLDAIESAQKVGCFDEITVMSVEDVKDPIVWGKVNGCSDLFFIAQWDKDITLEQIEVHEKAHAKSAV